MIKKSDKETVFVFGFGSIVVEYGTAHKSGSPEKFPVITLNEATRPYPIGNSGKVKVKEHDYRIVFEKRESLQVLKEAIFACEKFFLEKEYHG